MSSTIAFLNGVHLALTLLSVRCHCGEKPSLSDFQQFKVAALQNTSVMTLFTVPYVHVCLAAPPAHKLIHYLSQILPCTGTFRLSTILIARFLLHLQSASLRAAGSVPSSQVSSMHLNGSMIERVVGSLGASIAVDDCSSTVLVSNPFHLLGHRSPYNAP